MAEKEAEAEQEAEDGEGEGKRVKSSDREPFYIGPVIAETAVMAVVVSADCSLSFFVSSCPGASRRI